MSVMTVDPFEQEQARDAALWTGAALVVAALHVGLAVAYLLLRPAPEGRAEAPVIDVAFCDGVRTRLQLSNRLGSPWMCHTVIVAWA